MGATPLSATGPFRLGAILLIVGFLIVYTLTLDTGLQPYELHGGDLITHQYAQVQARPSNAPGYPLYTMGGWLWFHGWHSLLTFIGQPLPNPVPILSSYSTLWALLALWLLYCVLGHLIGHSRQRIDIRVDPWIDTAFCLLLTTFFGLTYFFWYYATTTEQYSSAVAQTLAIFYLYLHWDEDPTRLNRLYWLAFLCGLSLAHMLTIAFIVPPLIAVVLWRSPSLMRNFRAIATCVIAAFLPLASYAYVYLRGALHPQWWGNGDWTTPQQWFWAFVSTTQGRNELSWAFEPGRTFFGNGFPEYVWQELSIPLLLLGLVGIALLPRRHALLLYVTLLIYALFCWAYRFGNWFQVALPAYPLLLLGIAPIYSWLRDRFGTQARLGRILFIAALLIAITWRVEQSLPRANSRHRAEDTAFDRASILLNQPLPQNAPLFAAVDDSLALSYLSEIWGIQPDVEMVSSRDANELLAASRPVYSVADAAPALLGELTVPTLLDGLSADWITIAPVESTNLSSTDDAESIASTILYTITPNLLLIDATAQPAPTGQPLSPPTQPGLDVRLTWQLPTGIWPANLAISLRPTYQDTQLIDPQSGQTIQQDRSRPVYGLWPDAPDANLPVTVHDAYRLPLPTAPPQGADGILLIVYTQTESGFTNVAEIPLLLSDILVDALPTE